MEIAFLPVTVQEVVRGLHYYDPHFGAAFYDGTWNAGFDHAEALRGIQCPALLLHANFEIEGDGTLNGALDQEQADRAVSLLQNGQYIKVDSSHVINLEHPDEFTELIESFFLARLSNFPFFGMAPARRSLTGGHPISTGPRRQGRWCCRSLGETLGAVSSSRARTGRRAGSWHMLPWPPARRNSPFLPARCSRPARTPSPR